MRSSKAHISIFFLTLFSSFFIFFFSFFLIYLDWCSKSMSYSVLFDISLKFLSLCSSNLPWLGFSSRLKARQARGSHLAAVICIEGNSAFICGPGTWHSRFLGQLRFVLNTFNNTDCLGNGP